MAVDVQGRAVRLPRWQFDEDVLLWMGQIIRALDASDGWEVLSFLETPHGGLDGRTPRVALEQGDVEPVLVMALS